jgi:tetratricopeptide (TPR) repeat protein
MGKTNLNAQGIISTGDVIHGDNVTTNTYEASTPLALNLHQIPPPPRDFTGREAELTELLTNFEKGIAISGLHGQGGIGKTALALKLAEQLLPRYPDAQFYLDLRGASEQKPLTVAEALAHVIRAYHPNSKLPEDEAQLRTLYQSVLRGQRALVLMDNAKDRAQVEPLLPPVTCCLLVTSRQNFHLPGIYTKNLDALPPDDARELLLKIAPRITLTPTTTLLSRLDKTADEESSANQIARLCGYLPLALRVTASTLAERTDLSLADYTRRLNDTKQRLKLTGVAASLQLSYDLLPSELQKLWRALAVFPETFDRAAAMAVWAMEADPAQDALSELVKFSLLEYAPALTPPSSSLRSGSGTPLPFHWRGDGGEGRYHLHDLARLYADSQLPELERYDAQKHHAAHYETVLHLAKELYLRGRESIKRGLNLFDLEWKNIQAGQKWAGAHADKNNAAAQLFNNYIDAGAYLLSLHQHPRERIYWLEVALVASRRLKNRRAEGNALGNLGNAYADLGETRRAIEYYEQQLSIAHEIQDRRSEGAALGNLGLAYAALREPYRAIKFYEQRLVIADKIGDQHGKGAVLMNIGNAYYTLGETNLAIYHQGQALHIFRKIGDRRGEGNALMNTGNAYYGSGWTRQALKFHEQALLIFREIGDRRGEGAALFNISLALGKLRERTRAIAHAQAALKIYEQIEDPNAGKVRKKLEAWGD